MSPGATFERVYLALKAALASGEMRAGDPLEPKALGDDLASSITPVRDALHRLVGERIVEAPRSDGFRVPILTETSLRHLYDWKLELLLLALRSPGAPALPVTAADVPDIAAAALAIARRHPNPELCSAVAQLNARLAPVRAREASVLGHIEGELMELVSLLRAEELRDLRRALISYHRRRLRMVPQLIEALAGSPSAPSCAREIRSSHAA